MSKNIILCADGTGNRGGTTPDTNVFRTYQAIEKNHPESVQLGFYDVGVGTNKNKYLRGLSGAFGFGFRRNIKDLYSFLALHYDPGDKVFFFGFSRGAAEVRALNGMIASAGLVDGRNLADQELASRVDAAYQAYKETPVRDPLPAPDGNVNHGAIPITFLGVWDTVPALGFPQHWPSVTPFMSFMNLLFTGLDHVFDFGIFAHRFYTYDLTTNIKRAYHALAIDDERLSFHPRMWDEHKIDPNETTVEQVWFAGAHSNVGGGYGRSELAHVTLQWMMARAEQAGLKYEPGTEEDVKAQANSLGLQHNSRDGLGVFYRYSPRNITELSKGKLRGEIKIHSSVKTRMLERPQAYAPGNLPEEFQWVDNEIQPNPLPPVVQVENSRYEAAKDEICAVENRRIKLYSVFLESVLIILLLSLGTWFAGYPVEGTAPEVGRLQQLIAESLEYITPAMFDNIIELGVTRFPLAGILFVLFVIVMIRLTIAFRSSGQQRRSANRHLWVDAEPKKEPES